MAESKTDVLLLILMGVVILLMIAIGGLFIRMNQLQREVLTALAPLQGGTMEQEIGLERGMEAPVFTLPDTARQMVALRDFAGQKVLLAFFSTHCSACKAMYPHLKAFSENQEDVQVVMISQGSAEENRQLVQEQGFTFPVLPISGWDDPVIEEYQVPGTPFFYVIDGEGVIRNAGFAGTLEQLKILVEGGAE